MKNKLLEYELRNVDELIPYINNARTHSDEQVSKVMASIKEFGFLNPILISEENVITAGHCRLMAAKKLGMDKVPCIKENYLTPPQRKAYVIADNQLALGGGWNEELLSNYQIYRVLILTLMYLDSMKKNYQKYLMKVSKEKKMILI